MPATATLHGVVFDILGTRAAWAMPLACRPGLAAAPSVRQKGERVRQTLGRSAPREACARWRGRRRTLDCHRPARHDDPVFQRHWKSNGQAAAHWMPLARSMTAVRDEGDEAGCRHSGMVRRTRPSRDSAFDAPHRLGMTGSNRGQSDARGNGIASLAFAMTLPCETHRCRDAPQDAVRGA
jgi:hypothetical protein